MIDIAQVNECIFVSLLYDWRSFFDYTSVVFLQNRFFTDLESVYHILQILIFFMIITLVTTDLPNISGFVGSSLLHIYSISRLRGFRLFCTHRPSP